MIDDDILSCKTVLCAMYAVRLCDGNRHQDEHVFLLRLEQIRVPKDPIDHSSVKSTTVEDL